MDWLLPSLTWLAQLTSVVWAISVMALLAGLIVAWCRERYRNVKHKNEKPMPNWYEIARYALAPMNAPAYPQWLGMILGYPEDQAMTGVMTTAGMYASIGPIDACKQGFHSMLTAEMNQHQYVVVTPHAVNQLDHLQKWMIEQAITLFPTGSYKPPLQVNTSMTSLTLPPAFGSIVDLKSQNDAIADMLKNWGTSSTAITSASANLYTTGTPWPSAGMSAMDYVAKIDAQGGIVVEPKAPPKPPELIESELVPDVACTAIRCAHRLTSHVQNKPGESGPCVIPGCTCEQWRASCLECSSVSYPWRFVHTAACKSGQRMRQVLADRAELEQSKNRNRRARTSIEQIPEDF